MELSQVDLPTMSGVRHPRRFYPRSPRFWRRERVEGVYSISKNMFAFSTISSENASARSLAPVFLVLVRSPFISFIWAAADSVWRHLSAQISTAGVKPGLPGNLVHNVYVGKCFILSFIFRHVIEIPWPRLNFYAFWDISRSVSWVKAVWFASKW